MISLFVSPWTSIYLADINPVDSSANLISYQPESTEMNSNVSASLASPILAERTVGAWRILTLVDPSVILIISSVIGFVSSVGVGLCNGWLLIIGVGDGSGLGF